VRRAALALLAAATLLAACGDDDDDQGERTATGTESTPTRTSETRPLGDEPRVETIATGLEVPWELAFLPDGRALITERPGRVRLLERDLSLREEPVAEVDVEEIGEGGLLGLAVDPQFERNGFVYIYRTTSGGNEVARYRLEGDELSEQRVIAGGIAAAAIHDGGRIRFGPDGLLYFSTGDAGQDELAQDAGSLNGKILRMGPDQFRGDGGRPEVFTLGHRNPQGFDWQPGSGRMVEDEHGPDGDDEVNVLDRGQNYGWPLLRGDDGEEGFVPPVAFYPQSIAPSGATFVRRRGSAWTGDYLIGALVGEQIRRVRIDENEQVTIDEPLFEGEFGRVRTVVEGPDGALYALTSNRDGRGTPREGDDRVIRIVPPGG
jgi:glucose/arabinose dehydrogenase